MNGIGGSGTVDWDDVVVLVGVQRWDGRMSSVERLASGLAEHVAVLVVAPDPTSAGRERDARLQVIGPRLARVAAPGLAGGRSPLLARIDASLVHRTVRRALVDLGSPRVRGLVLSSSLPQLPPVEEEVRVLLVGDDLLDGWANGSHRMPSLERALHRAVTDADVVVAGSPVLADILGHAGVVSEVLPDWLDDDAVAATVDHLAGGDGAVAASVVGVVGDLAGGVDLDALDVVAAAGHDLLLVGRGTRGPVPPVLAQVVKRSNVEWVGPRPAAEIPGLVARCRVGLVPLHDTPYTRARLPLDALVHLAAGQPVVGTDCEPMRWLRAGGPVGSRRIDDAAPGMDDRDAAIARDADALAELVAERLVAAPDATADQRRRGFAARHRTSVRAGRLAAMIGLDQLEASEPVG
jgi:teichuronic acid biosynthesis glycosyltransferase TuaH